MVVQLTPQLEAMIEAKVASGKYSSASDVIQEAMRLLDAYEATHDDTIDALRADIQRGLDSGPAEPWEGAESIISKARARRDARQNHAE